MIHRCEWCGEDELYQQYHDTEWGVPSYNDQHLFEMLILEGAQAGLSWITVLKKRAHY
ncbi:MAG: DNA-3-methyladenine glycosylase I, partial [gamma proteobacterium symbiont of Bathyaustriella thionipta]|nr:DNA-3-methyladenine glycosylase I [gamma proteobacterium symbiont of Bathyaustriella thionipta]